MRERRFATAVLVLALVVVCAGAAPAFAITQGVPDGAGHPNVAAVVAEYNGQLYAIGSGTLIAPRVVLTAAHVTAFIQTFTDDVYVSFTPVFDPSVGKAGLAHGVMVTNLGYTNRQSDPGDIAVVLLDEPQSMTPASLPPAGMFDQMKAKNGLKGQEFTCVGYGSLPPIIGGGKPVFAGGDTRRVSVSSYMSLTAAWLFLSQNAATGDGGTGYGDSGGPIFFGPPETSVPGMLAGLTVWGDTMLRSTNICYRLDTPPARAFLSQFAQYGVILP
jgi:secreted trypsin-like serine protease